MHLIEDGKIIDMLIDIVNVTSRLLFMNCAGHSSASITREELIQWIKDY